MTPQAIHPGSARLRRDDRFLGRLAGTVQIVFSGLLGGLATVLGNEPDFVPRGLILFLAFGVPGLVGIVGAERRQRALLIAAAVTSFLGSFVAFSGVSLIFLVPAMLFAAGAAAIRGVPSGEGPTVGTRLVEIGAAVTIVVLLVTAGLAALLVTDAACWNAYPAPLGTTYQLLPFSNSLTVPPGASSSGCTTGLISARGVAIGAVLWIGATWLALRSSRPGMSA